MVSLCSIFQFLSEVSGMMAQIWYISSWSSSLSSHRVNFSDIQNAFPVFLTSEEISCYSILNNSTLQACECMLVSSETGVSWGLAALALLQHAKLQRHFLGAAVNRGNRRGMLSSATWRQLIRLLFKFYRPRTLTGIALFPPPDINT